eukprot:7030476-Pyramimonas_sp.AAC.1
MPRHHSTLRLYEPMGLRPRDPTTLFHPKTLRSQGHETLEPRGPETLRLTEPEDLKTSWL